VRPVVIAARKMYDIGHVDKTTGTTIVDVSDPKKPSEVATSNANSGESRHDANARASQAEQS
jgi:hypothetical protein